MSPFMCACADAAGFSDPLLMRCDGLLNVDCTSGLCINDRLVTDFLRSHSISNDNLDDQRENCAVAIANDHDNITTVSSAPDRCQRPEPGRSRRSGRRESRGYGSATGGVPTKRQRSQREAGRFDTVASYIDYNMIPAQRRLHVARVVCHRAGLVVVQLRKQRQRPAAPTSTSRTVFGVLRVDSISSHKFLGLLCGLYYDNDGHTSSVNGDLSPDLSRCLLRLPAVADVTAPQAVRGRHHNAASAAGSVIHVYDICSLTRLAAVTVHSSPDLVIGRFDPRFCHSRVALTGVLQPPTSEAASLATATVNDGVFSVNLVVIADCQQSASTDGWKIVGSNGDPLHVRQNDRQATSSSMVLVADARVDGRRPFDLRYSPDGHLLLVTVVAPADARRCLCAVGAGATRPSAAEFSVCVLDAETSATLRRIDYESMACAMHRCPNNFRPTLSRCCRYVAVPVDECSQPAATAAMTGSSSSWPSTTFRRRRRVRLRPRPTAPRSVVGGECRNQSGMLASPVDGIGQVRVYRLPMVTANVDAISLHAACRRTLVRTAVSRRRRSRRHRKPGNVNDEGGIDDDLRQLPLPRALIGYLHFEPSYI